PFADFDRLSRQIWGGNRFSFMPVDAYRQDDRFVLHIDLPGVDPDTIDLEVEKNTLTVSASREWVRGEEMQVILNERPTGAFSRQFFLGDGLDPERIEAGYDHGVLTVSIPVAETARPRKIEIGKIHEALTG
ncbi:MAG TPA: Hsp20/alpha crystallin family protein, partial [Acidimicrobiia bacterium]|nr:Hsp20/alpha crystallin family protein [Acidimicrobiia bacterium]